MGLTVSHGCFSNPYSLFHWWRCAIAAAGGIPLERMEGFMSEEEGETIAWSCLDPDVLHILLSHSDCDGFIAAKDCGPLADRLEEILPLLSDDPGEDVQTPTKLFIRGLRLAASKQEDVIFS